MAFSAPKTFLCPHRTVIALHLGATPLDAIAVVPAEAMFFF
jgi:hypothetical protein